jgi:hypothetical protein
MWHKTYCFLFFMLHVSLSDLLTVQLIYPLWVIYILFDLTQRLLFLNERNTMHTYNVQQCIVLNNNVTFM